VLALVPEDATVLTVTDLRRTRADDARPLFLDRLPRRLAAELATRTGRSGDSTDGASWVAVWSGGARGWAIEADGHLRTSGRAAAGAPNWASHPALARLVPEESDAAYVERGCVERGGTGGGPLLDPLHAYAVSYGPLLATARLGPGRADLFTRLRLRGPGFAAAYRSGSADPTSGRIGYWLAEPVAAARLAERRELPFAACGTD
jgi:hypothetical protein